jgi:hypothetical protein
MRSEPHTRQPTTAIVTLLVICLMIAPHATGLADDAQSQPASAPAAYEADIRAFIDELDKTYPFFELKGIREDWQRTKAEALQRVSICRSEAQFLQIVLDIAKCLRDAHVGLRNVNAEMPPRPPKYCPGISFLPAQGDRVVVMYAPPTDRHELPTGTVIETIDGEKARAYLEKRAKEAWAAGGGFSSPQRARLFEYRTPLRGKKGAEHVITYTRDGQIRRLVLKSESESRGWPHTYNMPKDLTRAGRSFWYAELPSKIGYMYLRRVDGNTASGIRQALDSHPDVRGWIVDLRGNGGGGYDPKLIEQIGAMPRPVAVLIDAGCTSAGETLARDFERAANARLFGQRTAGSSSAKRTWQFPSGIASVSLPTRSRWRNDRQPIEFNGIEPHEPVEAVPEELQKGLNSCILRAEEYILRTTDRG